MVERVRARDYDDVRHVGHYFRKGVLVVMDLTAMADEEARQLVDFAAGLICARGGDMQRLSPKVFMLIPAGLTGPGTPEDGDAHWPEDLFTTPPAGSP
jgi:FtsZ-interacting cell division protein YlmF